MRFSKFEILKWLPFILILSGIASAIRLAWLCDDAFISFRYAKNLVDGHGLVFNKGEYVEGYTNFLWTILMAAGMVLKIQPEIFSKVLGLLFFTGTIFTLYRFSRLLQSGAVFIPTAAAAFALHHHAQVFATSGLETSMFTFLVTTGIYFIFRNTDKQDLLYGMTLLGLASMTRPDGLLFYVIGSVYLLLQVIKQINAIPNNFKYFQQLLRPHLFMLFVFIPYWIWRYKYYGWMFPNTYYAKSGDSSFFSRGILYFSLFYQAYYVFLLIPFMAVYAFFAKKEIFNSAVFRKIFILLIIASFLYILYFTKVGGDFMFARFYIPVVPMLFLILEYFLINLLADSGKYIAFVFIMIMVTGYHNVYKGLPAPAIDGIVDENQVYKPKYTKYVTEKLKELTPIFKKNDIRIAIGGTQAIFAYYLETDYVLEAAGGLTDAELAHKAVTARGMVGHEKSADLDFLRKKKINLHMNAGDSLNPNTYNRLRYSGFFGEQRIIVYENQKMEALRKIPGMEFVAFSDYLDGYLKNINKLPIDKIRLDYAEFREYYFKYNTDSRESIFQNMLFKK